MTNKQSVELIDHMGDDLSVVNAARVSFDKASEWQTWEGLHGATHTKLKERDVKLISYLARENHWSPFSHAFASFRIKAPIFVARQLVKHVVGLSWNETSRRYVDSDPEFYIPETWRKRADNVKQGSSEEPVDSKYVDQDYKDHMDLALGVYQQMLKDGVCPEQARMVLPQSMLTEWIWSGSLYAFARVCNLRLNGHTQRETQEVARGISEHMGKLFPVSWGVLVEGASGGSSSEGH